MSYLIVEEVLSFDFHIKNELNASDRKAANRGEILIIDLDTKEFYVENDTWQKIPEK